MKKYVQKAMGKVAEKKQMTFDVQDIPQTEEKKKTTPGKAKPTYWVCVNGHVFKHNYQVHPDREKDLGCPVCGKAVKNKSTKTTYLYYLNETGRGDVKEYRADKIMKEKKRMRKKAMRDKTNSMENAEQEPDV